MAIGNIPVLLKTNSYPPMLLESILMNHWVPPQKKTEKKNGKIRWKGIHQSVYFSWWYQEWPRGWGGCISLCVQFLKVLGSLYHHQTYMASVWKLCFESQMTPIATCLNIFPNWWYYLGDAVKPIRVGGIGHQVVLVILISLSVSWSTMIWAAVLCCIHLPRWCPAQGHEVMQLWTESVWT